MADDQRIETVARALARHRLGHSLLTQSLPSDLARSILDKSVERLWPSLTEEAEVVLEALDGRGPQQGPPEQQGPQQQQPKPQPATETVAEAKPAMAEPTAPQVEVAKPEPADAQGPKPAQAADTPTPRLRLSSFEGL